MLNRLYPSQLAAYALLFFWLSAVTLPSLAQNVEVPIGAVIDWWRPSAAYPIPNGFVVADGSVLSDAKSPLNGMTLPDLRGRFVKGAQAVANIGQTGGAAQHAHQYYTIPHAHKWGLTRFNPNDGKTQWITWTQPMSPTTTLITVWSNGIGDAGAGLFPMAPSHPRNSDYYTDKDVGSKPAMTDQASSEPPYMGLLKIMRVR